MPNFRVGSTGCNSNMAGGRKLMTNCKGRHSRGGDMRRSEKKKKPHDEEIIKECLCIIAKGEMKVCSPPVYYFDKGETSETLNPLN